MTLPFRKSSLIIKKYVVQREPNWSPALFTFIPVMVMKTSNAALINVDFRQSLIIHQLSLNVFRKMWSDMILAKVLLNAIKTDVKL